MKYIKIPPVYELEQRLPKVIQKLEQQNLDVIKNNKSKPDSPSVPKIN